MRIAGSEQGAGLAERWTAAIDATMAAAKICTRFMLPPVSDARRSADVERNVINEGLVGTDVEAEAVLAAREPLGAEVVDVAATAADGRIEPEVGIRVRVAGIAHR